MLENLTWKRKILFSAIALSLSILILEICFRVLFAFYVGPSVLLYGTPFDRNLVQGASAQSSHEPEARPEAKTFLHHMAQDEWDRRRSVEILPNELKGYSKYFPNQKRVDFDVETGERFEVTINGRGFRGRDFSDGKAPGVIRIVCLGASSTFGYFDRDDETYPVYLEEILNERYPGPAKFEVINLGIPHLDSGQIYNLFEAEALNLKPDIVTFYEGNNDCEPPENWLKKSLVHAAIKKLGRVSLIAKFIDSISSRYIKELYPSLSDGEVETISSHFIGHLSKIYEECRNRGVLFVVANQQKNSQSVDRALLKGLTYKEEVEKTKDKLLHSGALLHPELQLLIHSVLMEKEEQWVRANHVPFVDIIGRLDHDRDVLVSWVHLSPKGNRMVAEALAEKILELNRKP